MCSRAFSFLDYRAYRIGQKRDVEVIRLVSQGTVEELMYIRQVYKVQLKHETLGNSIEKAPQAARLFRGVAGDDSRKGKLFGTENLLKYKDGSFMADIWKTTSNHNSNRSKMGDLRMLGTNDLSRAISNMTVEEVDNNAASTRSRNKSESCHWECHDAIVCRQGLGQCQIQREKELMANGWFLFDTGWCLPRCTGYFLEE